MANPQPIRKAVIPAAGYGTRFLPQTKAMPKQMMPIVDKPIIQYVVESLVEAGIRDIIIVTNYHERSIEDHFDSPYAELVKNLKMGGPQKAHYLKEIMAISNMANFIYVRQKGPYGNGTPLLNVRDIVGDEPFIYTWSDDMIVAKPNEYTQLIEVYNEFGCSVLGSIRLTKTEDYDKYGIAGGREIRKGLIDVEKIVEKPGKEKAPSNLANVSTFILTPTIFKYIDKALKNLKEGDELYYNDMLKLMLKDGERILAAEVKGGKYYDTGNVMDYLKTVVEFALKHPKINGEFRKYLQGLKL